MPIQACRIGDKPGFQYGDEGACYSYEPGSEPSKQAARDKAAKQGRAIELSKTKSTMVVVQSR